MRGYLKRLDEWNELWEAWLSRHLLQLMAVVVGITILLIIGLPLYVMHSTAQTVGNLSLQIVEMQGTFEQQRKQLRTVEARVRTLADEQKWLREQAPTSRGFTRTRTDYFTVTAYTLSPAECGKPVGSPGYGVTASGRKLTQADAYKVVAVDNSLIKFGTRLIIHAPQGDIHVVAADTGSGVKGNHLDLFVSEADRAEAFKWGAKRLKVTVLD